MERPILGKFIDTINSIKKEYIMLAHDGVNRNLIEMQNFWKLQYDMMSIKSDDLINELLMTTAEDDADSLKETMARYRLILKDKVWLADLDKSNPMDLGGDTSQKIIDLAENSHGDNLLSKDEAISYIIRWHDLLIWMNDVSRKFVAKFRELSKEKPQKPSVAGLRKSLKDYFKNDYLKSDNYNKLMSFLLRDYTSQEYAVIAYNIHKSKVFKSEENRTFKNWYEVFCASLKTDKKTYKPSQIEEFEKKCNLILIYLGNILK
jgi:hypothetical protein